MYFPASLISPSAPSLENHSELNLTTVLSRIEDLEHLLLVGLRVLLDLLAGKLGARGVLSRRVADHPREVADDEDDRVAEVLEGFHLPEDHRVAEVEVRSGGVEARLHDEGFRRFDGPFQFFLQRRFVYKVHRPFCEEREVAVYPFLH